MATSEIFADTSGWANYFVRSEPFHNEAVSLMKKWHSEGANIVTTNYILVELNALFISPLRIAHAKRTETLETITTASWVEIIHIDKTLDEEARNLLKQRQDKNWSLVDCSSFVVMRHRSIGEGFTSDHHFEQAGFTQLLK